MRARQVWLLRNGFYKRKNYGRLGLALQWRQNKAEAGTYFQEGPMELSGLEAGLGKILRKGIRNNLTFLDSTPGPVTVPFTEMLKSGKQSM